MRRPSRPGRSPRFLGMLMCWLFAGITLSGQTPDQPQPEPPPAPTLSAEPELNLVNLPTTQSLKRFGSYFRLTHRFSRDLRRGAFEDLAESLFGLDDGAVIGFEYRFAPSTNLQAGVHRSMLLKTIQMFGRYDGWRQSERLPFSMSVAASVEGSDNFSDDHAPALGAVLSRVFGKAVAIYATPMFVWNTSTLDILAPEDNTFFVGLGGRVRFRPTAYISAEISPRVTGYSPDAPVWSAAVEKFTEGGHMFQLNFSNSFGTTYGQIARGGSDHDVYLGFNITRKF